MKKLLVLIGVGALITGCVVDYPARGPGYGPGYSTQAPRADRDRDGIPNRYDRDRDGDGVPNRYDSRPSNPYR
jgi:hypothetical protein